MGDQHTNMFKAINPTFYNKSCEKTTTLAGRQPSLIITPPTTFSQLRRSIDVTWRHILSPRYIQRQKSVTGIHWKRLLSAKQRLSAWSILRPHPPQILQNFTNLLWAQSTLETDLITNNSSQDSSSSKWGQTSRSMSQGQKLWYHVKGLVIRNTVMIR